MPGLDTGKALEGEVLLLFQLVQKMRQDLASVYQSAGEGLILDSAADQINAINAEAEEATDAILSATERIAAVSAKMGSEIKYGGARPYFDTLDTESRRIMEACQVHDIIGQRLSRVVRTINAVEGTINALVVTLGDDGFTGVSSALDQINREDGDLIMSGPALKDEGLEQTDIDALFKPAKTG
tara:strand:- start:101227 stop:101778 length:552 start_codon:yes stop_codon:yes gene_type:complete